MIEVDVIEDAGVNDVFVIRVIGIAIDGFQLVIQHVIGQISREFVGVRAEFFFGSVLASGKCDTGPPLSAGAIVF